MLVFLGLIILTFLFLMSAFWSGAETALTSLSKYRIKKLIAIKKPLSATLAQWLKFPYYLLTTVLVGNTVNDLVLSYLATVLALKAFSSVFAGLPREAFEIATWLIVTFMLLVFGEITPKVFSRRNPEKVTILILPFLSKIMKISIFIIQPLARLVRLFFPKLELVPVGRLSYVSLEEIRGLISEANSRGSIGADASQMLQGVLGFGEMKVSHIMTPVEKIEAVDIDQDEDKFLDLLVETGRSRVPVYHSSINKLAGFIHVKDLLKCWKGKEGCFSKDVIRPAYFISKDKKLSELLNEFQSGKTHLAFVRDAMGNLAGLVTLEDLLEDVVGDILDEYDIKQKDKRTKKLK